MSETFFEALAAAPAPTFLPRVVPSNSREIAPGFQSAFLDDYLKVLDVWREENSLVASVANGRTTFVSVLQAVARGDVSEQSESFRLLEECVGPLDSLIHPHSSTVKLGLAGAGAGAGGGLLFGRVQQERDPDFRFDPALSTRYGRRAFLVFMGTGAAILFGLLGSGLGYLLGGSARRFLPERAAVLDRVVAWLQDHGK